MLAAMLYSTHICGASDTIKVFLNECSVLAHWQRHICTLLNRILGMPGHKSYDALTSKSRNCTSYMQNHMCISPNNNPPKYLC